MADNILVLSGKKQSGKSNVVKHIYGLKLKEKGVVDTFDFTADGDLLVPIKKINPSDADEYGVFDIFRQDDDFLGFLEHTGIWPEIERFSFADSLKMSVSVIFGIDPELYKTNEGKQTLTHITWKSVSRFLTPQVAKRVKEEGKLERNLTVRELLEYFGTHICRHMDDDCWVRSTWNRIQASPAKLAVIDDCRFPNELTYFKERGAKVIRLKRQIDDSNVESETALDHLPDDAYDLVVYNQDMTMTAKNAVVSDYLIQQGLVPEGLL